MEGNLLNFKGQNLTEIPTEVRNAAKLTHLNLQENRIGRLPEWLAELQHLKVIYLSDNLLTDIDVLTRIPSLEVIHLDNNQIRTLPPGIGRLTSLKRLFIRNNHLYAIPAEMGQLKALKILLLAGNFLTHLPEEIGSLASLETLNVFNNRLESLPVQIGALKHLFYLQLSENKLTTLPESLGSLSHLKQLDFFANEIQQIPLSFKMLPELEKMNLSANQVTRIENLPLTIRQLSIYANPVHYLDEQIVQRFTVAWDRDSYTDYLFVDTHQIEQLPLQKENFCSRKLRILDLEKRTIHWNDLKDVPIELQQKWQLTKAGSRFE